MAPRTIALLGQEFLIITEDGEASEAITPGYLVEGHTGTNVAKQTGTTKQPVRVALERDEMGRGIDDSLGVNSAGSADYAVGETVKVGHFAPGMRFYGFIASGENVSEDELMDSAGDGTLAATATPSDAMVRCCEAVNATDPGDTRIRVEVV